MPHEPRHLPPSQHLPPSRRPLPTPRRFEPRPTIRDFPRLVNAEKHRPRFGVEGLDVQAGGIAGGDCLGLLVNFGHYPKVVYERIVS